MKTVKDLIEHLKNFPMDMEIILTDSFDGTPFEVDFEDIYVRKGKLKIGIIN